MKLGPQFPKRLPKYYLLFIKGNDLPKMGGGEDPNSMDMIKNLYQKVIFFKPRETLKQED